MKFGPKEIKELNEYLRTGRNRKREFLGGGITFASDLTQPEPKKEIVEIDAINAFVNRNPRADGGRIGFKLGTTAVKLIAKNLAETLGRLPTQTEIAKKAKIAIQTVKNKLTEGIDFAKPLDKKEAGKLGGKEFKGVTSVTDDFVKNLKDLKATHVSPTIETTKAGGKTIRVKFTGPIKNDFKDINLPATRENLNLVKSKIDDVVTSNLYKNKAKIFKTPEDFRKLKRLKEAMYKKQDPYGIYKALQKYKTEKFPGTMSKDIVLQHGDAKFTTQTLSRMGLIPSKVNISPVVERAERIRNELLSQTLNKLKSTKLSVADKQKLVDNFNNSMKGMRSQLKGTEGQGLVNFQLLKLDNAGAVTKLKDVGFNPKKGLAYGDELGELDFANITKDQADEIINLGKRKIDEDLIRRTAQNVTVNKMNNPLNLDLNFYGGGRVGFMAGTIPGGYGKQANRYLKEIESDMHRGYQYYKRHGGKKSFKDYMRESMSRYFAGGGIAKEAGDPSGPPPDRGPLPQGLPGLLKRGMKI